MNIVIDTNDLQNGKEESKGKRERETGGGGEIKRDKE